RNTVLPPALYWLAVSANEQLDSFSHVSSIYAQAFRATWVAGQHPPSRQPMVLPPDSIVRSRDALIGIAGVTQVMSSFGGVPAEEPVALRTRISERLRHKHRALTPLDYEMLILQEFPQVYKVKCFANVSSANPAGMTPGHLLIIPVPYLNADDLTYFKPQFDGYLIERIREFVVALAPTFCEIAVESPLYEEIQVRCVVQFRKGRHPGKYQNMLQEKLCEYISPWSPGGNGVHFGWRLAEQEIKSYVQNLPYVDQITEFSLLRVAPGELDTYIVDDTALAQPGHKYTGVLTPNTLWSTAVPLAHHFVVSVTEKQRIDLQTGYDELEIGSTFIISQ
ncbi:MAG: baseplate J/gp47 family protein, partial [Gammaproteobacteria bacterium]